MVELLIECVGNVSWSWSETRGTEAKLKEMTKTIKVIKRWNLHKMKRDKAVGFRCMFRWKKEKIRTYFDAHMSHRSWSGCIGRNIVFYVVMTGTWAQNISGQCDAVRRLSETLNLVWRSYSTVDHPEVKPVGVSWSKIAKNGDVCSRMFVLLCSSAVRPWLTVIRYLQCIWRALSETDRQRSSLYYRSCPMCANTHSSSSTCTEQSTGGDVVQFQVTIC